MEHLTKETFLEKIFDYEKSKEWNFQGDKPAIIDFYADWCGPCKMVSPILEELSNEFGNLVDVYKINTEEQQEISAAFGIRSIPSVLFIPKDEKPQMDVGARPKEFYEKAINEILGVEKPEKKN